MTSRFSNHRWVVRVNAKLVRRVPADGDAGRVAAMFALPGRSEQALYEGLRLELGPGRIVAVIGPSGAGKSVLLREVARQVPDARWLDGGAPQAADRPAVALVGGGDLRERLAMLSRCGLAEAWALVSPVRCLSGGEVHRLALAKALQEALSAGRPTLVIADEFAACLDSTTAAILCRQVRKLISRSQVGLLVATPRPEVLDALRPDLVITKPPGLPPLVSARPPARAARASPRRWPIARGTIADYKALGCFHYLAGPPAAHKRVYVVRPPAGLRRRRWEGVTMGDPAAVLVVSPPLLNVRGRNVATGGRYAASDRAAALALLNDEMECISRVIVHPMYRGCGLAVRLVRHALASAETAMVEALAAMGHVHPFFERAGMRAYHLPPDEHVARLISAAEAVGLSRDDLAGVGPVRRLLAGRRRRAAAFLRRELDLCVERLLPPRRRRRRRDDLVAEVCRRTACRYVYYLARKRKESSHAV